MAILSTHQVVREAGRKCYQCDTQIPKGEWFLKITLNTRTKWGNTLECGICVGCIDKAYNELCMRIGQNADSANNAVI